jgi:hypothetical protein
MTTPDQFQPNGDIVVNLQIKLPLASLTTIAAQLAPAIASEIKKTSSTEIPDWMKRFAQEPERMAYSMKETAELLGVSYMSVHRLVQRGLLKPSSALRIKIISKQEIQRFLKSTTP